MEGCNNSSLHIGENPQCTNNVNEGRQYTVLSCAADEILSARTPDKDEDYKKDLSIPPSSPSGASNFPFDDVLDTSNMSNKITSPQLNVLAKPSTPLSQHLHIRTPPQVF
mmetsp:Transcript_19308/g.23899  ORF Transcript_19308/g.23899 Transcript_19308/m.23899 type:complete len:110 (-) Transcript_19308:88-417(-)